MGIKEDYESRLNEVQAIKDEDLFPSTNIPIEIFLHEAEKLFIYCQEDREALEKAGLDWKNVEEIMTRINVLRQAEAFWNKLRFSQKEAFQFWKEKSPEIYELRSLFLHVYRYAYRGNAGTIARINAVAASNTYPGMIQDLIDLSEIGKGDIKPLEKVNFDLSLLEKAPLLAAEAGRLYATAAASSNTNAARKIRDKAFVYLKTVIDEICATGQFVFWKNEERRKGYSSSYLRRIRRKKEKNIQDNTSAGQTT